MKKRVYSDPSMEIVILNGEDIICASEATADNTTDVSNMWNKTQQSGLDYDTPVE